MISKAEKRKWVISKSKDIERVLRIGEKFENELFLLSILKNKNFKVAFITQRTKKAVDRNWLKRRIKILYTKFKNEYCFSGEIVFLIKNKALKYSFHHLVERFHSLLEETFEKRKINNKERDSC